RRPHRRRARWNCERGTLRVAAPARADRRHLRCRRLVRRRALLRPGARRRPPRRARARGPRGGRSRHGPRPVRGAARAVSRVAPWAARAALDRLPGLEGGVPAAPAEALRRAAAAAAEHVRRIEDEALLLYAGGNVPGSADRVELLAGQPSMGYPGDKYQAGIEPLDVIEVTVTTAVAGLMRARFAEVRPTSATLANLAVYAALARPGDTIAALPDWAGGHLSHHAAGAPGIRGLRVAELPYDAAELDVDLERLPAFLDRERPVLVVVGASLMLRPHRLERIAAA